MGSGCDGASEPSRGRTSAGCANRPAFGCVASGGGAPVAEPSPTTSVPPPSCRRTAWQRPRGHRHASLAAFIALSTRWRADLRPYSRAHIPVSPSIMSCSRLPDAVRAASTSSDPNRASLSRCSTTMVPYSGKRSAEIRPLRWPFNPLPTSATTLATRIPRSAANAASRATCRSRSAR